MTNTFKMYGVAEGVTICQDGRVEELNTRISSRMIPSSPLEPVLSLRPMSTIYNHFPIIQNQPKSSVQLKSYRTFNVKTVFNPGTAQAPWVGFSDNINTESTLRNQFFALQKSDQSEYVPESRSQLYIDYKPTIKTNIQVHTELSAQQNFDTFNPNCYDLGWQVFNNSTRNQLQDVHNTE